MPKNKSVRFSLLLFCSLIFSACTSLTNQKIEDGLLASIASGQPGIFVAFGPDTRAMISDLNQNNAECEIHVEKIKGRLISREPTHLARVHCDGYSGGTFLLRPGGWDYLGKIHITGYVGKITKLDANSKP